jgi:hypothetical protein
MRTFIRGANYARSLVWLCATFYVGPQAPHGRVGMCGADHVCTRAF